jgi:hypothetical protein
MLIRKPVTTWIRHAGKIFSFRYHVLPSTNTGFLDLYLLVCPYAICLAGYVLSDFYHAKFFTVDPPVRSHQQSDLQTH